MSKFKVIRENGKGGCPPWDGPCDTNSPCSKKCKKDHKKMSNRKRRLVDKEVIREEKVLNMLN